MSELQLALYKTMCRIRISEAEIKKEYPKDEMKTPMHMSLGQEGIAAGVCAALPKNSHCYGTYRSHALYLAWTEETDAFFAELYGKSTGVAGGKAGSMHLASPDHGLMATSAVVATTIPLALGDAFEAKYNNLDRITAVFFGDGATDEGAFWESLNFACLMKLPVLFICEDNDLSIHTTKSARRGYDSLADIVSRYRCEVLDSQGYDAEHVYNLAKMAVHLIKTSGRPAFLKLTYYRYLEHVGVNEDFHAGYRVRPKPKEWLEKDPVHKLRQKLLNNGFSEKVKEIENQIELQVTESRLKAQKAPYPSPGELTKGVFDGE